MFDDCLFELGGPHSAEEPVRPGLPKPDSFQPENSMDILKEYLLNQLLVRGREARFQTLKRRKKRKEKHNNNFKMSKKGIRVVCVTNKIKRM